MHVDQDQPEGRALALAKWLVDVAINGGPGFKGAPELADEYIRNTKYRTDEERIDALVKTQALWNFGTGFITSFGGPITLLAAIPASLTASFAIQTRLIAAIAHIYGHDLDSEAVRTTVLLCLLGSGAGEAMKKAGITIGTKTTQSAISKLPGRLLIAINKQVGFRLLTKAGETGAINLIKIVPVVGGVAGGTFDGATCYAVGRAAKNFLRPDATSSEEASSDSDREEEPLYSTTTDGQFCPCGRERHPDDRFCPGCGRDFRMMPANLDL